MAKAGETPVEHTTFTQAEGFFSFGPMETIIRVGKKVGARSFGHDRALLDLGLLYQLNGKNQQAQECLAEAQLILAQCKSKTYTQQVQQALAAMP